MDSKVLALDTETNYTELRKERYLLGLGVTTDFNTWYIPVGHKPFMGEIVNNLQVPNDLCQDFTNPIIAHNVKFDCLEVLPNAGVKVPTGNLWCTMMMSVYIDENHIPGHDLDAVLATYIGERKKTMEQKALKKFGWVTAPPWAMGVYCEQDVSPLPKLYEVLRNKSKPIHLEQWEKYDRPFMILLNKIEERGILVDREKCLEWENLADLRLREIQEQLEFDPAKPSQLHPKLFDEPPFGLGLTVPSRTPKTNQPQVSLAWLEGVGHPVTALVYEYRKLAKQKSSYFSAYLRFTTRDYPRLHPNFKQNGTETGRLSCENPNLQQIPREEYADAHVKKLFLPEEGKELWEIDFRTIEYRLQAVYARSTKLLDLFENEGDFHQLVADDVSSKLKIPIERFKAKTINYLMSFGGGVGVLQKQLGVKYSVAEQIHKAYKASYPEIFDKADEAQRIAEDDMEIDLWSGRTRHFRYPSECRQAFNSVIQGGAFEIVKRSLIRLDEAGFDIANQVHDSVWIVVDNEKEVEEAQHIMEDWTKPIFGLSFRTDRKRLN